MSSGGKTARPITWATAPLELGAASPRAGATPAARPRHFAEESPPTGERGVTAGTVYFVIDGTARLGPYSGLGSAEFIQCARPGSQIVAAPAEEQPPPPPPAPPPEPPPTLLEQVVSSLWGDDDNLSAEDREAHLRRRAYEVQFSLFTGKMMRAPPSGPGRFGAWRAGLTTATSGTPCCPSSSNGGAATLARNYAVLGA